MNTRSTAVVAMLSAAAFSLPSVAQMPAARAQVRETPTPSPTPTPLVMWRFDPVDGQLNPCRTFVCPTPTPRPACDPPAFALAWQAFIDSPAPVPVAPPCEHPSLICASQARSAERAAQEVAEQEYLRRLDEVNAHAARCR
jgi:hypothetical protein